MDFCAGIVLGGMVMAMVATFFIYRLHNRYEKRLEDQKKLIRKLEERLERSRR